MNNDLLVVQRTLGQNIDSYGRVHTRTESERFWLNGREISRISAALWTQGLPIEEIIEVAPAPEPIVLQPGLHEYSGAIPLGSSIWILVPGYPVGPAATISQLSADTTQQNQYIVDTVHDQTYVIIPDPNSPHRSDRIGQ